MGPSSTLSFDWSAASKRSLRGRFGLLTARLTNRSRNAAMDCTVAGSNKSALYSMIPSIRPDTSAISMSRSKRAVPVSSGISSTSRSAKDTAASGTDCMLVITRNNGVSPAVRSGASASTRYSKGRPA